MMNDKNNEENVENDDSINELENEPVDEETDSVKDNSDDYIISSEEEENVSVESILAQQLKDAYAVAEENMEGWQRAQAEFVNYRKRIERDRIQQRQDQTANILGRYLEVVDDFDLALKNRPTDDEGKDWAEGLDLIFRKMMAILESENVVPMNALGSMFDPNLHEAISQEESSEHESGQVIEVLKQGYLIGDRVIRPSLVRIAS